MNEKTLVGYIQFGDSPCFLVAGFRAKGDNALFVQSLDSEYWIIKFSEYEISAADAWVEQNEARISRRVGDLGLLVALMPDDRHISGSVNDFRHKLSDLESSLTSYPFFHYEVLKFLERQDEAARAIRQAAKLFHDPIIARSWINRELETLRHSNDDPEKNEAVSEFVGSRSFAATHSAIARLQPFFVKLDNRDIAKIAEAIMSNNQISWIYQDSDVTEFFSKFISLYSSYIDSSALDAIREMLKTSSDI